MIYDFYFSRFQFPVHIHNDLSSFFLYRGIYALFSSIETVIERIQMAIGIFHFSTDE